jgi:hypothetical protein
MRFVLILVPLLAVGLAYQYVSRQIAVSASGVGVPFPAPGQHVALKPLGPMMPPVVLDSRELARLRGQSIANETTRFNNRMEDVRNYGRNPAGWSRPPF